ncbi:hypothetical protein YC2023_023973 [Brassica napus]
MWIAKEQYDESCPSVIHRKNGNYTATSTKSNLPTHGLLKKDKPVLHDQKYCCSFLIFDQTLLLLLLFKRNQLLESAKPSPQQRHISSPRGMSP